MRVTCLAILKLTIMKKIIYCILVSLSVSSCQNSNIEAEIKNAMLECVEESIAPGMGLGYYSDQTGTILLAVGNSDVENNKPLKTSTHYPIQSVTKVFIGVLTHQLIEDGKLRLESTVDEWIDSVPNGNQITIRHLLNHTSGLNDYRLNPAFIEADDSGNGRNYSLIDLINAGLEYSVDTEVGEYKYSNTNSAILARIIEIFDQQSIGQVLKEQIFLPANMSHSYYKPEILDDTTFIVKCYKFGEAIELDRINYSSNAGGGIVSTIEDMMNFGKWFLENEYHLLMAPESELLDFFDTEGKLSSKYGLSIEITHDLFSIPMTGHAGGNPGFIHFFYFSPETGEIIIYYVNEGRVKDPFGKFMKDIDIIMEKYR